MSLVWTKPLSMERENPETTKHVSIIYIIQKKKKGHLFCLFVCLFIQLCSMRNVDMSPGALVAARRFIKQQKKKQIFTVVCVASFFRHRCYNGSSHTPTLNSLMLLNKQTLESRPHNRQVMHRGSTLWFCRMTIPLHHETWSLTECLSWSLTECLHWRPTTR